MGSCMTKSDIQANSTNRVQQNPSQHPPGVNRLLNCQKRLRTMQTTLLQLISAMEEQAKEFIKLHKRGKGIAALKRFRLYTNMAQDIQAQVAEIENVLMDNKVSPQVVQKLFSRTEAMSVDFNNAVKIIGPLNPGETVKEREAKAISVFRKHHIQNSDVFHTFALMESDVNGITMTTSTTVQKSEQPNSLNALDLEEKEDDLDCPYMAKMSEGVIRQPQFTYYCERKQFSL